MIAEFESDGTSRYLRPSEGTNLEPQGLFNSDGNLVEAYVVNPYGKAVILTGPDPATGQWFEGNSPKATQPRNPFLFGAYYYDAETMLYYAQNRYYDPQMGRFLSRDPMGMATSPNMYEYGLSNPATYIDPTGELPIVALLVWGGVALLAGGTGAVVYGAITMERALRSGSRDLFEKGQSWVKWGTTGAVAGLGLIAAPLTMSVGGFLPGLGVAAVEGGVFGGIEGGLQAYSRGANAAQIVSASLNGIWKGALVGAIGFGALRGIAFVFARQRFYRGTTFYEAIETVQNQAVNFERVAQRQAGAVLDLGPGLYLTRSRQTALEFAKAHGVFGRGGGPGLIRLELSRLRWWLLKRKFKALDNIPISDMSGHFQTFIPPAAIQYLSKYAKFFSEVL